MRNSLVHKAELLFWDTIIFNLSRFRSIRKILAWGFHFFDQTDIFPFVKMAIMVSLFGFCFGFGLTFILSLMM